MTISAPRTAARSVPDTVAHLRATFRSGRTRPIEWRLEQLHALVRLMTEREAEFAAALEKDLGRDAFNAWLADVAPVTAEAKFAIKHLKSWVKPVRVKLPISVQPGK